MLAVASRAAQPAPPRTQLLTDRTAPRASGKVDGWQLLAGSASAVGCRMSLRSLPSLGWGCCPSPVVLYVSQGGQREEGVLVGRHGASRGQSSVT